MYEQQRARIIIAIIGAIGLSLGASASAGTKDQSARKTQILGVPASSGTKDQPAPKTQNGWVLHQYCVVTGDETVSLTPKAIKAVNGKSGIVTLSQAPFTSVHIFNSKTKKIFHTPLSTFNSPLDQARAMINGLSLTDIPLVKAGETSMFGLKALNYKATEEFAAREVQRLKAKEIASRNPKTVDYVLCKAMDFNANESRLLVKLYGLPMATGLPLQFKFHDMDNDPKTHLDTKTCHEKTFDANEFALPVKYQEVKSVQTVSVGENTDLDSMMMLLGSEMKKK